MKWVASLTIFYENFRKLFLKILSLKFCFLTWLMLWKSDRKPSQRCLPILNVGARSCALATEHHLAAGTCVADKRALRLSLWHKVSAAVERRICARADGRIFWSFCVKCDWKQCWILRNGFAATQAILGHFLVPVHTWSRVLLELGRDHRQFFSSNHRRTCLGYRFWVPQMSTKCCSRSQK